MISRFLVAVQFAAFGVLLLPLRPAGHFLAGGLLIALGLGWVAWTVRHNRPGNFNIRPESRAGAQLIRTGPYRWVRHPMYLGSLVAAGGAVVIGPLIIKGGAWLVLLAVLTAKAKLEEAALLRQFADYAEYRRERRFLVPGLW